MMLLKYSNFATTYAGLLVIVFSEKTTLSGIELFCCQAVELAWH
jgi:hypothetical protein